MSHSCPNLVSTSFLYNPYIPFFNLQKFFIYYNIIDTIHYEIGSAVSTLPILVARGGPTVSIPKLTKRESNI